MVEKELVRDSNSQNVNIQKEPTEWPVLFLFKILIFFYDLYVEIYYFRVIIFL